MMIVTVTLVYEMDNEKDWLDVVREIYDYASKGLVSSAIDIRKR